MIQYRLLIAVLLAAFALSACGQKKDAAAPAGAEAPKAEMGAPATPAAPAEQGAPAQAAPAQGAPAAPATAPK